MNKSALIREVGNMLQSKGHDLWFIHCPSDNNALDGVIIPDRKIGVIDGTPPRMIEPRLVETSVINVDLNKAYHQQQLSNQRINIERLEDSISQAHQQAYFGFADALRIHDEWEAHYIDSMSFKAADEMAAEYIHILFGDRKQNKPSRVDYRFLGAATPQGAVDFVPNLTAGLKRYLVKGRPGSGKSTMLKKIAAAGIEHGFDVEIYRCGLDPNSLDMVIVRELGFAIFDSTAPHEYFPERATDEIVDVYARCMRPGTDERIAGAVADIKARYTEQMKRSTRHLTQAKAMQDELAAIYAQALKPEFAEQIGTELVQEINASL